MRGLDMRQARGQERLEKIVSHDLVACSVLAVVAFASVSRVSSFSAP